jgi:hypothetical protein
MAARRLALLLTAVGLVHPTACGEPTRAPGNAGAAGLTLDVQQIPADLQHLAPLAETWSADDVDRFEQIDRLSAAERQSIVRRVEPYLDAIDEWVDSYDPETLPEEVSAFFWLRVAVEEMRMTIAQGPTS